MDDSGLSQHLNESNRLSVDLVVTDVKMALTLLDLAETTKVATDRSRRIGEAHQAYTASLHFLERLSPTKEQAATLRRDLATLKDRLQQAGVSI